MRFRNQTIAKVVGALALAAFVISLSACNKVVLAGDWKDGNYVVTADKCKSDGRMMIGYTVEDDCNTLVVDSQLEKGTLHVTLGSAIDVDAALGNDTEEADADANAEEVAENATGIDADALTSDETYLEIEVTGTGTQEFPVEPGDYSLSIAGDDGAPATGTITISTK